MARPVGFCAVALLLLAAWLFLPHASGDGVKLGPSVRVCVVDASASVRRRRPDWLPWARGELARQARRAEVLGEDLAVIAFAKDVTGEFRLSTSPTTDADVFRGLPLPNTPAYLAGAEGMRRELTALSGGTDPLLVSQGVASGMSELSLLADLGRLQQTEHLILSEIVTAQALFGEFPVIASSGYYKANNSTTYTSG